MIISARTERDTRFKSTVKYSTTLMDGLDHDSVYAELKNGILYVTFEKIKDKDKTSSIKIH